MALIDGITGKILHAMRCDQKWTISLLINGARLLLPPSPIIILIIFLFRVPHKDSLRILADDRSSRVQIQTRKG